MSIALITHDLGVVAEVADEVAVMYCGRIVEWAPVERLFAAPRHPYTLGLLGSLPRMVADQSELSPIRGSVPQPGHLPPGCAFAPRCDRATPICRVRLPDFVDAGSGHGVACLAALKEAA
jgi:peptide/nickel transport system ATP-binding protein